MPNIIWRGSSGLLEQPGSPEWSFTDQFRLVRRFSGPYAVCLASAPLPGAISVQSGWRVLESNVTHQRGGIGILTITYGNDGQIEQGAQLPPDEEEVGWEQQERALSSHPRYAVLAASPQKPLEYIAVLMTTAPTDDDYEDAIVQLSTLPPNQKVLAEELFRKLRKGQLIYWVYAAKYTRREYSWEPFDQPVYGNVIEVPTGNTIVLPGGLEWLRLPDALSFTGTHHTCDKKWIGVLDVDNDIYTP